MSQTDVLHKSAIGDVVDVATPSSKKLQILGLLWTALAFVFCKLSVTWRSFQ